MNIYQEHTKEPTGFMPRVWLLALAGLLLLLIVGGNWFYRAQEQQLQEEVETNLTAIARLKVDQIVAWREDQLEDATTLAASPLFYRAVTHYLTDSHTEPDPELNDLLALLQEQNDFASIMLLDLDGEVIVRSEGAEGEMELPEQYRPVLETAVRENHSVFIDLHQHTDSELDTIHISVIAPIYDDPIHSSEPLGALLVVTDASELLYPLVNSWPVSSQSAETLLIRQEGDEVLFLNELRHQANTALSLRLPLSQSDLPEVMAIEGQSGFVRGYDYRDVEVVAVLLPVPDSPWYMISKVDATEAFVTWQFRSGLILAILVGLVALILGGWQYFWQRDRKTHYLAMYKVEAAARISAKRHEITLKAIGDGVIVTDAQGQVELLNPVAETLTGWSNADALGKPLTEVFNILDETTRTAVANPVTRVLREGKIQGLANHTLLITRDGEERPIADSAAPIFNEAGDINGVVLVFREQAAERLAQRLTQLRLDLNQFATDHTLAELLTKTLDDTGDLVNSPIGFYHLVSSDQQSVSLQEWSTRTKQEFCRAKFDEKHYSIADAGVWTECVIQKAPVIHNDYAALENKQGMPRGHAKLVRELLVPVVRDENVVAILGVGNKPTPYTDKDVELVSFMADLSWQIAENKRDQEKLQENQAILATAEEVAGMGSWKWDLVTEKVTWSKGMFRLFDVSPNNFEGDLNQVIADRIHPDDIAAVQAINNQVLAEHKPSPLSYRIVLPDGRERTVWAQGELVLGKSGEPVALTGYVQDITKRRQREKERENFLAQIRQQAERLQKVMDAAPEGIILLDSQYKLLQANSVARQSLAVLTQNVDVASGTLSYLGDHPLETLLTSPPKGLWHEVVVDERIFEVSARQLEHAPEQQGWVLVLRETTKQREFEEQLHRQERLASVGKLAAGIAHDFNNLLAVIVLYAQLLQAKLTLQPKEKEQLETIVQQANRAARLIQQILDFSRRSNMTKQPLELRVMLKEEVALLKRTLPENIEIELLANNDEFLIHADVTRIQQVIMNLAVNARDAMPEGGRLCLELDYLTEVNNSRLSEMLPGSWIHLSFSDSGIGIPPHIIGRIFDPFFTTKEPGDGTGLGLAQVHGIIGQHDGFIDVLSEVGKGTTFDIYLPRLDMDIRFSGEQQIDNLIHGRGQRVLIVEDEAALREALSEVLQEWRYEVLQAGDGEQAIALLTENDADVDLIISDLVMPKMGGVDFVKALRQRNWQVPVLIMSGHPLEQDMDLLKSAGVAKVLPKPLNPILLNQAIAEILAG